MIDLDFGPIAILVPLTLAFVGPFLYSVFVDNYDKKNAQIKQK